MGNIFDANEYEAVFEKNGINCNSAIVLEILAVAKAAEESAYEAGNSDGYDRGFIDGQEAEAKDAPWLDDLKTGLDLIDTDRSSAKVYLDRCTKQAGRHLIEVSPCLL